MTPAQQARIFQLSEEIAAALGPEFWGRVELRIEAGKLRLVDVSQRLKKVE